MSEFDARCNESPLYLNEGGSGGGAGGQGTMRQSLEMDGGWRFAAATSTLRSQATKVAASIAASTAATSNTCHGSLGIGITQQPNAHAHPRWARVRTKSAPSPTPTGGCSV